MPAGEWEPGSGSGRERGRGGATRPRESCAASHAHSSVTHTGPPLQRRAPLTRRDADAALPADAAACLGAPALRAIEPCVWSLLGVFACLRTARQCRGEARPDPQPPLRSGSTRLRQLRTWAARWFIICMMASAGAGMHAGGGPRRLEVWVFARCRVCGGVGTSMVGG